jgi:hypothetical protein
MAPASSTDENVRKLTDREGAALLEAVVRRGSAVTVAARLALPRGPHRGGASPPCALARAGPRRPRSGGAGGAFARQVAALPAAEREGFVRAAVRGDVARVLGVPEAAWPTARRCRTWAWTACSRSSSATCWPSASATGCPPRSAFDHPSSERARAPAAREGRPHRGPPGAARRRAAAAAAPPIAVVGMSCRFPGGADDADAYWRVLMRGPPWPRGPRRPVGPRAIYQAGEVVPGQVQRGARRVHARPAGFDAAFFGISRRRGRRARPAAAPGARGGLGGPRGRRPAARPPRRLAHRRVRRRRDHRLGRPGRGQAGRSPYGLTGSDLSFVPGAWRTRSACAARRWR